MYKILSSFMMMAAVVATSCTKDVTTTSVGSEGTMTLTVSLPSELQSRATVTTPTGDPALTAMRLFVWISYNDAIVDSYESSSWDYTAGDDITFQLASGLEYQISAWADYGDSYYTVTGAVDGKPSVTLADTDLSGSDMYNDAYFVIDTVKFDASTSLKDLTLGRPFGLMMFTTTDCDLETVENAGLCPTHYTMSLDVPDTLDLLTGEVSGSATVTVTDAYIKDTDCDASRVLSYDYFFASATASAVDVTASYRVSADGYTLEDTDVTIPCSFTTVPLQRNYITSISGKLLTKAGDISVSIDQTWAGTLGMLETIEVSGTSEAGIRLALLDHVDESVVTLNISSLVDYGTNLNVAQIYVPQTLSADYVFVNFADGFKSGSYRKIMIDYSGTTNKISYADGTPYDGTMCLSAALRDDDTLTAINGTFYINLEAANVECNSFNMGTLGVINQASLVIDANSNINTLKIFDTVNNIDIYGNVGQIILGNSSSTAGLTVNDVTYAYTGQAITINNYNTNQTLVVTNNYSGYTDNVTINQ